MYFIVGPLRTGSSLLSRCLDDHPDSICFCESEINRTLFSPYCMHLHFLRMRHHGFGPLEIVKLLDSKRQNDVGDVTKWYADATEIARSRFAKPNATVIGDKSPDFYLTPPLFDELLANHQLVYSIRDPRSIFCSIQQSEGSTDQEKHIRWNSLINNFQCWEPHLDRDCVHCVRYEDVVLTPSETVNRVYQHIGLSPSDSFLEAFERKFPSRFLWKTAIDWETGIRKDFDPNRVDRWRTLLSHDDIDFVTTNSTVQRIMCRFGYSRD